MLRSASDAGCPYPYHCEVPFGPSSCSPLRTWCPSGLVRCSPLRTPALRSQARVGPGGGSPLFGPVTVRGAPLNTLSSWGICKITSLGRPGRRSPEEPREPSSCRLHMCSVDEFRKPPSPFRPPSDPSPSANYGSSRNVVVFCRRHKPRRNGVLRCCALMQVVWRVVARSQVLSTLPLLYYTI